MSILMAQDVREALGERPQVQNRSLMYDKYVPIGYENDAAKKRDKEEALQALVKSSAQDDYGVRRVFGDKLKGAGVPMRDFVATLSARLMVNMAGGVIENAGLCLDRHFGMPYIPGTALKGIALRAAIEEKGSDRDPEIVKVFGEQHVDKKTPARKGKVSFLAAYPMGTTAIELDIITCHHARYYREERGYEHALDNEEPNPVKFPAVAAGAQFRFVVVGVSRDTDAALVQQAAEWLRKGVTEIGVGAKTSAGYGWFEYDEAVERGRQAEEQKKREAEERARREAAEKQARLEAMDPIERAMTVIGELDDQSFVSFLKNLDQKTEEEQRAALRLLRGPRREKWKNWKKMAAKGKGKQEMVNMLTKIAQQLGEDLP